MDYLLGFNDLDGMSLDIGFISGRFACPQEVIEWVREDEFGNVVARGIVGQDDPYEEACNEGKAPEQDESGATVNRCEVDAYAISCSLLW